ncbi:MAG: hypothetical protein JSV16_06680 [Candidatus Hydrogenedentota bacterium]|nr:MAG: hypothetical protein JSV16_06680 [Candidatus Hydrogenedentota bacterium]
MKISDLSTAALSSTSFPGKTVTVIAIFLGLFCLYGPSLDFYFFYDDFVTLDGSRLTSVSDIITSFSPIHFGADPTDRVPFYRPLSTYVYFGVMQVLVGAEPFYFRLVNLGLLGAVSFMVYILIFTLREDRLAGFFGAVLFALNTAHALTQLWISCVPELISTLFATLSLYTYILWVRKHRRVYLTISVLSFLLGLLSKEIAIAVPGLALLFEMLYGRPEDRKDLLLLLKRLSLYVIIGSAYLIFRLYYFEIPESGPYRLSVGLFVLKNFARYFFWAIDSYLIGFLNVSSMDHLVLVNVFQETDWWLIWLKFLVIVSIVFYFSRRNSWKLKNELLFSMGWFVLGLFAVLFAPGRLYHYYLLFPGVGLMLLIGGVVSRTAAMLARRSTILATAACVVYLGAVLAHSTAEIRKEQAPLRGVTLSMRNIEKQLRHKIPNPPDNSGFVFSGNYGADWLKNLSPAIRVIYDNPTINATALEDGKIPEKVKKSLGPVYLVHVQNGIVYVTYPK